MGANAQTSVFTFTAGQVLTAAQLNATAATGVPVFATTTDRDAAFGGTGEKTLAEGQTCYIEAAPKRLQVYNGTAWVDYHLGWSSYTPTFTNLTLGNGTLVAKYIQLGKLVTVEFELTFGSTTSITGVPEISLPVTGSAFFTNVPAFSGFLLFGDAGIGSFTGATDVGTTATFRRLAVVGGNVERANVTSTSPFTFGTNDGIGGRFYYEAA